MIKTQVIDSFSGLFRFLSNFSHPVWVTLDDGVLDGVRYPSVEHAFQAAKTLSKAERMTILSAETPNKAKRLGGPRGIVTLRKNWDGIKLQVMEDLLRQKFDPDKNSVYSERLKMTTPYYLVEGNTWHDQYWGDCKCSAHENIPGENHLGRLLVKIRRELISA